ncbi:DUF4221 family protein [Algoriphagus hitonicola]|uniref:DUF4221 family protein n=1 Tax=Algoriphagus hitonicola TaxID=435880 RepID=UPI00360D23FD
MRNSLIAAILVLSGCTQNAENVTFHEELVHQFGEQKTLIHSETRTILIDSLSLPFYDYFQLINRDESPYLVGFNRQSVSLDFIPLRQGDAIDHLVFADDGPNAVDADLDIIHLFSEDSIVTIQDRALRFKVLNREGKLINSYRKTIRDFKGVEMYPVSYSYLGQWPVFLDSVWVLPVYPDLNVKKKLYYERNKFMIYDPVKDEVVDEFGAYPQMYRGDNYFDVLREPNLTPTPQGTFLVTFPADRGFMNINWIVIP